MNVPASIVAIDRTEIRFEDSAAVIRELQPDEPVYCFCPAEARRMAGRYLADFPGDVAYAVKANATPMIVEALARAGIVHFDVASLNEIDLVRSKAPGTTLLYDNPVKSRAEIERAYRQSGVRSFALDDAVELQKIRDVIGADPSVQLSVRFKLHRIAEAQDLSSKFGASRAAAPALLRKVADLGYRPALTFHPGSQCRIATAYGEHVRAAAEIAAEAGVTIDMLNTGGGFPVPYTNHPVPPLREYFDIIRKAFEENFHDGGCKLVCEPGRGLVGSSVSLITRVKHRRSDHALFLNDGIYGGLLEQFMSRVAMPARVFRDGVVVDGPSAEFDIFGPTCDATDHLPLKPELPEDVREGDWVEFGLMGAYGSATATRFNGFISERYVAVARGFPLTDPDY